MIQFRNDEKIGEMRVRWLGHVERKTEEDVVRRTGTEVSGHKTIGRLTLRWSAVIQKYMEEKGVQREVALVRRKNKNKLLVTLC